MTTADRRRGRDADGAGPALWFGLLGGAAAWAVQFLAGYLISEGSCVAAAGAVNGGSLSGSSLSVLLVSLAAFVVAVLAALAGRRVWLKGGEEAARAGPVGEALQGGESRRHARHPEPQPEPHGGSRWVGLAGFMLSGVFAFVIVVQVLPLFIGGGCA